VRLRYGLAVFAKALDVKLDCFTNQLLGFGSRLTDCDAAR
jgi:hypothetical protein